MESTMAVSVQFKITIRLLPTANSMKWSLMEIVSIPFLLYLRENLHFRRRVYSNINCFEMNRPWNESQWSKQPQELNNWNVENKNILYLCWNRWKKNVFILSDTILRTKSNPNTKQQRLRHSAFTLAKILSETLWLICKKLFSTLCSSLITINSIISIYIEWNRLEMSYFCDLKIRFGSPAPVCRISKLNHTEQRTHFEFVRIIDWFQIYIEKNIGFGR